MMMVRSPFLLSVTLLLMTSLMPSTEAAFRSFDFDARVKYAPLLRSLPNQTAIYHKWPPKKLRKTLPNYISAALITSPQAPGVDNDNDLPLIGPPIHVQVGDVLSVSLKNSLSTTGLSLHWHGFEMTNALEYDGVVGVTQCPISPNTQFVYEFAVEETPGTYWWHTHSGTLGIHAINAIHGPLIVHPKGEEKKRLVDRLNSNVAGVANETNAGVENPWYYDNERILFFKDGFLHPDAIHLESQMGGLNEAVSKDDSGHTVGTSAWEFGTCNGRMREIVTVSAGETYRFRIINGGVHYGLRINIADLKMKVIAADSEPVEPVVVDGVFVHVAERFDIEVTIPDSAEGQYWIRADSIESAYQGYQSGVRAILNVVSGNGSSTKRSDSLFSHQKEVYDPEANIRSPIGRSDDHVTLNCFERKRYDRVPYGGKCLPITTLSQCESSKERRLQSYREEEAEVHFIDSHFQPYPQHSHFIRLDDGPYFQHVNPVKSMLDPSFGQDDMHPNTASLHVAAFSTVILIWRTTSLMDHPMHLHGLKMEILGMAIPVKQEDCTLSKCKLNSFYESHDDVRALAASIPPNKAVLKDTFIIPAGGAVVTRIHTQEPSLWYSHCHLEMHHFDGMAFILNVGDYSVSSSRLTLPNDYPSCDSPHVQTQVQYPSCDCYENSNTILGSYLTSDYKCSRDHLCHHVNSRAANLEKYQFAGGDEIHSNYRVPGWGISFITVTVFCLIIALVRQIVSWVQSVDASEQTWEAAAMVKVDESVNPPLPESHSQSKALCRRDSGRLSTKSTRSFSESMRSLGSTNSAAQEPTPEQKSQSKGDLLQNVMPYGARPRGPTESNTPIPKSTSQPETERRRDAMRTYKTASSRSWCESARSFGSMGLSVASDVHSCTGTANISSEFISRPKGVTRKDFMLTYQNVSGRSWADNVRSDDLSIKPDGNRTSINSFVMQSEGSPVRDDEDIFPDTTLPSNKPKSVSRRDSTDSFLSLISSLGELDEEEEPPRPKRDRSYSNASELSEPSHFPGSLLSLIPSIGELDDEEEVPKPKRDRSCSNASELSEPQHLPGEQKCPVSAMVHSHLDAQPGTQPSRRVSFNLGTVQPRIFDEKEMKGSNSAVETAKPITHQVSFNLDKEDKRDIDTKVSRGASNMAQGTTMSKRIDTPAPFSEQLKHIILTQYKIYRPLCMNGLRVFEVSSLGILTGFLFYDVGNKTSFMGLSQKLSLFFFSTTLWTFTRMYPSVGFSYQWSLLYQVDFKRKRFDVGPVVLGRLIVVLGLESFWPMIYVFVCYPFASVFGSIKIATLVGLFLVLNNLCYISLGSLLGVYSKRVPLGMIGSTIFSQTSLVAAGFFTKLPPALDWIRFISPFYWCFRGILKSCFKWNDTLECFKGSSEVGANQCYLEYHAAIDQYKERGINVATYNDPSSNTVYLEYICLVLLLLFMNFLIFLKAWFVSKSFERQSNGVAIRTGGLPSISRYDSITDVILSRYDSSRQQIDENEDRNIARRIYRSISAGISARFNSGSEEAAATSGNMPAEATPSRRLMRGQDSTRQHVLERLRSSNAFTWK